MLRQPKPLKRFNICNAYCFMKWKYTLYLRTFQSLYCRFSSWVEWELFLNPGDLAANVSGVSLIGGKIPVSPRRDRLERAEKSDESVESYLPSSRGELPCCCSFCRRFSQGASGKNNLNDERCHYNGFSFRPKCPFWNFLLIHWIQIKYSWSHAVLEYTLSFCFFCLHSIIRLYEEENTQHVQHTCTETCCLLSLSSYCTFICIEWLLSLCIFLSREIAPGFSLYRGPKTVSPPSELPGDASDARSIFQKVCCRNMSAWQLQRELMLCK